MIETDKSSEEPPTSADSKEENGSPTPSLRSKVDDNAALAYSKPSVGKLFRLMDTKEKLMQVVSFVLMIGSEAANLITPLIVANAYDVLVDPTISNDEERMSDISHYMILAIIVSIAGILTGFLRVTIQGVVGERVVARLRCRLYKQILKQGEIHWYGR
jgi:ABC-type multidrug transport system fused ATPase/permease subunit